MQSEGDRSAAASGTGRENQQREIIVPQFRLPNDAWPVLHEFFRQIELQDAKVFAGLRHAVPPPVAAPDAARQDAITAFLRTGDATDATVSAIWAWAEEHRLVRPLTQLRARRAWESLEGYCHWNYCRSVVGMALTLLWHWADDTVFPAFAEVAESPLRYDPVEVEEYLTLAAAARHISTADHEKITRVLRNPSAGIGDAGEALVLAGVVPVGDEASFDALARFQIGLRSADRVGRELGVDRQVAERWVRGAAALLVGKVDVTRWLRDPLPAGRPRKGSGDPPA